MEIRSDFISDYIDPEHYDLTYSWYRADVDFYVSAARDAGGPVLEAACGTGRILLPALAAGADIDGFDLNPGMIEVLKRKAAAQGLQPRVMVADMRDFTMPRRYALIMIPFRAFQHLLTTHDQVATLLCCREHLVPEGRLVLDVFFPSLERLVGSVGETELEREFPHPETGNPIRVYARRVIDRVNQILQGEHEVHEFDARGEVTAKHPHGFKLRWIFRPEMELLLEAAGFKRRQVDGGFDGQPLRDDSKDMVWTAWKD